MMTDKKGLSDNHTRRGTPVVKSGVHFESVGQNLNWLSDQTKFRVLRTDEEECCQHAGKTCPCAGRTGQPTDSRESPRQQSHPGRLFSLGVAY
jgi:hypothetical protein